MISRGYVVFEEWNTKDRERRARRKAENPEAVRIRDKRNNDKSPATPEEKAASYRKCKYGISVNEFIAMLDNQGGLCAICCKPLVPGRLTHVDHSHDTGKVRGLLCEKCNPLLGYARDDRDILLSAVDYLDATE